MFIFFQKFEIIVNSSPLGVGGFKSKVKKAEQLLVEKQLNVADLKQLLSLLMLRADFLSQQSNIFAKAEYEKCIGIIELIEANSTVFDASISRYKSDIYEKIS
jgi:hypothetical protein